MPSTFMKHSSQSRRTFLLASTASISALALGSRRVSFAQDKISIETYRPIFFADAEWNFVRAATARLIPEAGDGPGALSAHVPVFIDRQLAGDFGAATNWYMHGPHDQEADPTLGYQSPLTPAETYRVGIVEVDANCRDRFGSNFADLSPTDQDAVLGDLESGSINLAGVSGVMFFEFLLENTKEGYFADPKYGGNYEMQAWAFIGFPGARASFREWVDQYDRRYPLGPVSIAGERA
jgi:gluconate 2-dehydrogenase gamma chain